MPRNGKENEGVEREKEIKTVPSTPVEFLDAVVLEVNMGLELKLYESVFSHIS